MKERDMEREEDERGIFTLGEAKGKELEPVKKDNTNENLV